MSKIIFYTITVIIFSCNFSYSKNISGKSNNNIKKSKSDFVEINNYNINHNVQTFNSVCDYNWVSQNSGTPSQLLSVSAVSDLVGWTGGNSGTVRKTINGGLTWTNGNPNPGVITGDISNIYAWSNNDALATASSVTSTFIYKTTNGGLNWIQTYSQINGFINAIQMISVNEGYATGDPVNGKWTVLKTTDGGASWSRMPNEPVVIGSNTGWNNSLFISGSYMWFGTNGTKVYYSADLGLNWNYGSTSGNVNSFSLHFNSVSNGLAAGDIMVKSTNGGLNYSPVVSPGVSGSLNGIDGTGTDWWAIRNNSNIYRSTDNALTWNTVFTQPGAVYNDIDLEVTAGCPKGWVVGDNGLIARMSLISEINNYNNIIPSDYSLSQNFPNPFNPSTNINFSIPISGNVNLKFFDLSGKEIMTLINEFKTAGNYVVGFNASELSSGTYVYRLQSGNFIESKKMLLIK